MVLAELCHRSGFRFSLAHCNFRLRGTESDGDEAFVRNYAKKVETDFYVTHFDTVGYVNQHKVSVQMAARQLRYTWFEQLMKQHQLLFTLTAHHANDVLETFLINLSRGTGIDGLTGIPSKTGTIRRPLLPFTRAQIEQFASQEQLAWREDTSNLDTKYLRNSVRLEIVPKLSELHPTFFDNFKNTLHFLGQTETVASSYVTLLRKELFVQDGNRYRIDILELRKLQPLDAFLYGLFNAYGFREWENMKDLLDTMSGKKLVSETHVLIKDRNSLILSPIEDSSPLPESFLVKEDDAQVDFPLPLKFSSVQKRYDNSESEIFVQKNALKYPLELRKWKKGDYFCPLGLRGRKKLSKFFKDEKIDVLAKKEMWLLCSEDQIVWVIGKRADDRFKVIDEDQEILKIEIVA